MPAGPGASVGGFAETAAVGGQGLAAEAREHDALQPRAVGPHLPHGNAGGLANRVK